MSRLFLVTSYRVYADGTVVHEDDWAEWDNAQPYLDDYEEYHIPQEIINHLQGE